MGKFMICLSSLAISYSCLAAEEVVFHTELKRSVLDLNTDPQSQIWEQYPSLYEICYKNADAKTALDEIMKLKEDGILFSDWQTEAFQESAIDGSIIEITVYNEKMLDDGIEEEEAFVTHEIAPCPF